MGRAYRVSQGAAVMAGGVKTWLVAVAILASAAAVCADQPPGRKDQEPVYSVHDIDRDGFIDRREYYRLRQRIRARSGPGRRPPRPHAFEDLDSDADGRVSHEEMVKRLAADAPPRPPRRP